MSASAEAAAAARRQTPLDAPVMPCPLRFAIEVLVLGEDDKPLSGILIQLRLATRAMRTCTGGDGLARFEGLEANGFRLGPPDLDTDSWTLIKSEPLPPERALSDATASWDQALDDLNPSDGHWHHFVQGDGVDRIALLHGLSPETIWRHERNAAMRRRRESLNVLLQEDAIFVPPVRRREIDAAVQMRYVLKRRGVPSRLRLRLLDDLQTLGNIAWTLRVPGQVVQQGLTNADGVLVAWVVASASSAVLSFVARDQARDVTIALGALPPVHEPGGWQTRLRNLGFQCEGSASETVSEADRAALRRFQESWALPVTGEPDADTVDKIYAVHDSASGSVPGHGLYAAGL